MTPTHDVVQKLLGAVKELVGWVEAFHCQCDPDTGNAPCSRCDLVDIYKPLIAQTEAQLAGGVSNSTELIALANQRFADLSYKGFDERSFYNGFLEGADVRIKEASQKGALVAPKFPSDAEGALRSVDASMVASGDKNLSGDVPGLPGDSQLPESPTNACIRSAKRVIAALNLPEGGGVAFDGEWAWFVSEPIKEYGAWIPDSGKEWGELPSTAIPPWPGDFRGSFITLNTQEVME